MPIQSQNQVAEQIRADSARRQASTDMMPVEVKRAVVYNEDALLVHPDQVFLNPRNSRKSFDDAKIDELAASIRLNGIGVIQPLTVRPRRYAPVGVKQYEVIAGDRRLLAAQRAQLKQVPIIVRPMDDRVSRRINLIENLQRQDLLPLEMGEALAEFKKDMQSELDEFLKTNEMVSDPDSDEAQKFPMARYERIKADTQESTPPWVYRVVERAMAMASNRSPRVTWEDVGGEVGLKERSVYYYTSLLDLPEDVQDAVTSGELSQQQSRAITTLKEPAQQRQLLGEIQQHGLSGERATERAREIAGKTKATVSSSSGSSGSGKTSSRGFGKTNGALSLSENSRIGEFVLAVSSQRDGVSVTRAALQARVARFGSLDATSRQELRGPLQKLRAELEAMEALIKPPPLKSEISVEGHV